MSNELTQFLPPVDQELNTDLDYIRKNQIDLCEQGVKALEGIMNVADQSQHPRAYEVLANMLSTVSTLNKDLKDTAMARQLAKGVVPEENKGTVNNLNFYGTTAEFQDLIDKMHKDDDV